VRGEEEEGRSREKGKVLSPGSEKEKGPIPSAARHEEEASTRKLAERGKAPSEMLRNGRISTLKEAKMLGRKRRLLLAVEHLTKG